MNFVEKIKDTPKAFDNFKNKQKSVWSNVFWYVKVCIFWKCVQYTIHWDKAQMLKKFPSDKINGTKMPSFFFRELQLITVLLLICNFYMSWSTKVVSVKLCGKFSVFDSISFLLKFYIFVQQNAWTLWLYNVIIPFKVKLIGKSLAIFLPDLWFWKFSDICVSRKTPKIGLETNFLDLENRTLNDNF